MADNIEDHDTLIRIEEKVNGILEHLKRQNGRLGTVESKIAKLENWRSYILGAAALAGLVAAAVMKFF